MTEFTHILFRKEPKLLENQYPFHQKIVDFVDWCTDNQYLGHYNLALTLFEEKVAYQIYDEFEKVINNYNLPDDIYMMDSDYDEMKYLSLEGSTIDEEFMYDYLSDKDDPEKEFYRIQNKFKVAIPYFQFRFTDIIHKHMEYDVIASIINERLNKGLNIEQLAEQAEIEVNLLEKIEKRKQTPSLRILNKILKALDKKLKVV